VFVATLVLGALVAPVTRLARVLVLVVLACYAVGNLGVSAALASKHGWRHLRVLPAAFGLMHLGYGAGFLVGLLRFARRREDGR